MTRATDPNSAVIRFRQWLARKISPVPASGEAWCMKCDLNDGRTLIVSTAGWAAHVRQHRELGSLCHITVRTSRLLDKP